MPSWVCHQNNSWIHSCSKYPLLLSQIWLKISQWLLVCSVSSRYHTITTTFTAHIMTTWYHLKCAKQTYSCCAKTYSANILINGQSAPALLGWWFHDLKPCPSRNQWRSYSDTIRAAFIYAATVSNAYLCAVMIFKDSMIWSTSRCSLQCWRWWWWCRDFLHFPIAFLFQS